MARRPETAAETRARVQAERAAWERQQARCEITLRQILARIAGFVFGMAFVMMVLAFVAPR